MLAQHVHSLQAYHERLLRQDALADLESPYQFVGVHVGLSISPSALLVYFGTQFHVPGQVYLYASSVVEAIGIHVSCTGAGAAGVVVAETSVGIHFQPVGPIGKPQSLSYRCSSGAVLYCLGQFASVHVSHGIGETSLCVGVHSEAFVAPYGRIEVESCAGIPVAVHILWGGHPSASLLVIFCSAAHAVLCGMEIDVGSIGPLAFGDALSVVGMDGLCEGRLQFGISQSDVQRVGIAQGVRDKVCDGGLSCAGMIPCVELLFLGESVSEVECRAGVYHRPCHLIVPDSFGIVHLASLWLHHSAEGKQISRTYDAQLQVDVVVLVDILRTALLCGVGCGQISHLPVVVQIDSMGEVISSEDGTHIALTCIFSPRVLVTGLQIDLFAHRLGV